MERMNVMKEITVQEVKKRLAKGEKIHFVDVREVAEVEEGHIPGIIHIPLGLVEFRMHELDKNIPYIIVCRSGGRSGQAAAFLDSYGYDVTNMVGGMLDWEGKAE